MSPMSSSSTSPQWKHDVFVSFNSEDVRETLISDLFKRLNQVGIGCFRDDNREGTGKEIDCKRLEAICQARFALVVFSTNYANSSWCLNELVKILNYKSDHNLVVIPIFYKDRASVLNLASDGEFKQALESVEATGRDAKKREWRSALAGAEEISGYELKAANGDELKKFIDKIAERLVNQIHSLYSNEDFVFGPFGGNSETSWNNSDINGIDVRYGNFIESIKFKVDAETSFETPHDGYGKDGTFKVRLTNGEYISSFFGYFPTTTDGPIQINCLTFRTNKRILGPIGTMEGEYFSVPSKCGQVVEFFWRENDFLESIGARVKLHSTKFCPVKSLGLFGRKEGSKWDDGDQHTNVRKIIVELDSSGEQRFIRSIKFQYEEKNGELWESETHGHPDGNSFPVTKEVIKMDQDEYLTLISGYYTNVGITSLSFLTNKKRIETIDGEEESEKEEEGTSTQKESKTGNKGTQSSKKDSKKEGTRFSSPATDGKIVGFYGWSDGYLRGIGAYFEREPFESRKKVIKKDSNEYLTSISGYYTRNGIKSLTFGTNKDRIETIGDEREPFGGGNAFDDREFDGVKEIHLLLQPDIRYIKFVYDDGSEKGRTVIHGDYTGGVSRDEKKVRLDYPREYLTSISGYTREDGAIQSLTFYSNRKIHCPFGKETKTKKGKCFWYPSTGSRIIGFYGTWSNTLNSIGVYAEPIPHLYPFKTTGPFGGFGGTAWDDGVHTNVRGFHVTASGLKKSRIIQSIRFMYDDNGPFVLGSEHGETGNDKYKEVMLDYPKDRLVSIKFKKDETVRSIYDLEIFTLMNIYGPYAPRPPNNEPIYILPEAGDDRIVGFLGRAGSHLNSIGAHLVQN